jgi:site-specific DNA recombinase
VVYRGQAFRGDHEPILDVELFAAVQAKLSAQAVERRCRLRGRPALLTGRLFDEHGQRMTPTHTNKKGVRYRYYVSQAMLRQRSPGPIGRVPAPELEAAVTDAIRRHLQGDGTDPKPVPEADRELIELLRVTLCANEVVVHLRQNIAGGGFAVGPHESVAAAETTVTIPWSVPAAASAKGIAYVPAHNTPMQPGRRELLLIAIAKARRWIKDIERGHSFADIARREGKAERGHSFADIARREGKAERHIRHLAPLAFVSPRIVTAIIDGTAPATLTVTTLATSLPYSWAEQAQRITMAQ